MNILFYVEPLIERGQPYRNTAWASRFAFRMATTLRSSENDFYIILSDAVEKLFFDPCALFTKVVFSQKELLQPFPGGYLEASATWYTHSYTTEQMMYYVHLMQDKLSSATFDLIITYTPVPFLAKLYPYTRILHMEYSLFSRKPFPETWYLDCCGMFEYSFLNKYQKEIKNIKLDENQTALVLALQEESIHSFSKNNAFKEDFQKLHKKFKYLVLLPLQFSQYYAFDCLTRYKSQFDFLCGCLDEIPKDIGVIFTMHPYYPVLSQDAIRYVTSRYQHAVFLPNSRIVPSASQWMMPYVDGVITVSSSLGLQTLLFKKKLFAIGNRNMEYIADANNLQDMHRVLSEETRNKESFLYFIVTRYAISGRYLFNREWLECFIKKSCTKNVNQNFYDLIDAPEKIFLDHIDAIRSNKSGFAPSMYVLVQGIYSETYRFDADEFLITGADEYTVTFYLEGRVLEKFLRIDPLEGHRCSIEIIEMETDATNWQIHSSNAFSVNSRKYIFFTEDPVLYLCGDFTSARYFRIRYKLKIFNDADALRSACQEEAEQAFTQEKERQIALYENSMSWKITAPLRKLKRWFT